MNSYTSETAVATVPSRRIPVVIAEHIKQDMPQIANLLPGDIPVDQFRAALYLHLSETANLAQASPQSIASAVFRMAYNGFLPKRDAAIVVFKDRKAGAYKAEVIPEYRGLIRALDRTGKVAKAYAQVVHERDTFDLDYGQDTLSHKPCLRGDGGPVIGAYAIITMLNGTRHFHYMCKEDLDRVRTSALGRDQDAWVKHTNEMYRKTPLKNLCKMVQLTPKIDTLVQEEEAREEESAVIAARGKQAASELFGGYHDDDMTAISDVPADEVPEIVVEAMPDTPLPQDADMLDIWEAALCGSRGKQAEQRRSVLLEITTGKSVTHPEHLFDVEWEAIMPIFEHLCAFIKAGNVAEVKTSKDLALTLLEERNHWMMRQAPQGTAP